MCIMRIGGDEAEFLEITLFCRSHPHCNDFWDGNWLDAGVEFVVGGFRGSVVGYLRAAEFVDFHKELSSLQESLRGTAEFNTLEGWFSVRVVGDGRGHMTFQCVIQDGPGTGNYLTCKFPFDQSFVQPFLSQLKLAIVEFPIVGRRPTP